MDSLLLLREGQVIEVLFDATHHLTDQDWLAPPCANAHYIPQAPVHLFLPSPASPLFSPSPLSPPFLLSPTLPPSPTTCAWDAARRTAPRPTSAFLPHTRGLDETALFLCGAPGAEEAVRRLACDTNRAREPRQGRGGKKGKQAMGAGAVAEVTETMTIQRLREEIARAESGTKKEKGAFRGLRKRFQLG